MQLRTQGIIAQEETHRPAQLPSMTKNSLAKRRSPSAGPQYFLLHGVFLFWGGKT